MAGVAAVLTIAGDASQLKKTEAQVSSSADRMSKSVKSSSDKQAASWAKVTSSAVFLTNGISELGSGIQAVTDLSRDSAIRADRLARAQLDVSQAAQDVTQAMADARQAHLDLAQAQRDLSRSALDVEQAQLDAEAATNDYAAAVAEFGAGSLEARQADLDRRSAMEDLAQAQEDAKQAAEDARQANLDLSQSTLDVTDAQIAQSEAAREAIAPPAIQVWAERLSALSPLLFTVIGAVQLLSSVSALAAVKIGIVKAATIAWTAIQWLLNVALTANPIGLIIAGIAALIAIIVLIATKTTWFQDAWKVAWGAIKTAAEAVGNWFKDTLWHGIIEPVFMFIGRAIWTAIEAFKAMPRKIGEFFSGLGEKITAPFKWAFNKVADFWNGTIGKLSWTVPSWVPFIGGNTISAPRLPKLHTGGVVPGLPGQEVMAVLRAGERVSPASGGSSSQAIKIHVTGSRFLAGLIDELAAEIRARGGDVQVVLGR